ncbi:MAG TPA: NAD-dependent epimerase, partial [Bacteroidales bacterium]|nr:NAD-dependent epimerase [Bacteroidales bacterium]
LSFTPKQLVAELKNHVPNLKVEYKPDFRQKIAESWPASIDDSVARKDWG